MLTIKFRILPNPHRVREVLQDLLRRVWRKREKREEMEGGKIGKENICREMRKIPIFSLIIWTLFNSMGLGRILISMEQSYIFHSYL